MRLLICLLLFPLLLTADEAPEPNYVFRAELVRVVNGNSVAMNIDLGFGVWVHNQTLTLLDTEASGPDEAEKEKSQERTGRLRELLTESTDIIVKTVRDKDAKPVRYLAVIWADGININEEIKKPLP